MNWAEAMADDKQPFQPREKSMKTFFMTALLSGTLITITPAIVLGAGIEKKGSTSYVTHFVFHPMSGIDVPNVGKATALEAVGPTENMKGQAMLDKMKAKCAAVSIESGDKKYIDGACTLTDADGDVVFSTFDTRDLDKSQPKMNCGTHIITGGTGCSASPSTGTPKHSAGMSPSAAIAMLRSRPSVWRSGKSSATSTPAPLAAWRCVMITAARSSPSTSTTRSASGA